MTPKARWIRSIAEASAAGVTLPWARIRKPAPGPFGQRA